MLCPLKKAKRCYSNRNQMLKQKLLLIIVQLISFLWIGIRKKPTSVSLSNLDLSWLQPLKNQQNMAYIELLTARTGSLPSLFLSSLSPYIFPSFSVLEFLNNLWGLGTRRNRVAVPARQA
jgi:hypothetical protein